MPEPSARTAPLSHTGAPSTNQALPPRPRPTGRRGSRSPSFRQGCRNPVPGRHLSATTVLQAQTKRCRRAPASPAAADRAARRSGKDAGTQCHGRYLSASTAPPASPTITPAAPIKPTTTNHVLLPQETHPRHRRRRLPRQPSLRASARRRQRRHLSRQLLHRHQGQHRPSPR